MVDIRENAKLWDEALGKPDYTVTTALAFMEQNYHEDPTLILMAVRVSWLFDMPLPEWAHMALAETSERFFELDGDMDLNKALGGARSERKRSVSADKAQARKQYELGMHVGEALGANAKLGKNRRKTRDAVYRQLSEETGFSESTLERALRSTGISVESFTQSERGMLWPVKSVEQN